MGRRCTPFVPGEAVFVLVGSFAQTERIDGLTGFVSLVMSHPLACALITSRPDPGCDE